MKPDLTSAESAVELSVGGMTCAACASRIERRLNRLEGVSASVNYATERAVVRLSRPVIDDEDLELFIRTVEATGYTARPVEEEHDSSHRLRELGMRLVVAIVLGIPVLVLSMIPPAQFAGWQWVALALAVPVTLWSGWPFHRAMVTNLRHGQATMDTLISVGVLAALGWSVWALVATPAGDIGMTMTMSVTASGGDHHVYLEVASTAIAFILAGRWFETRSKRRAGDAIRSLLDLGVTSVTVRQDDGTLAVIGVDELSIGDSFLVPPGERVATDGIVIEGSSTIDISMMTGESVPVDVSPGSAVVGSAINGNGLLVVSATGVGANTQLAQMARLVTEAQTGRAPIQRLADRVSAVFVPTIIGISVLTTIGWLLFGSTVEQAFAAGVAVLIIACPCALGLATPMALLIGTGRGASRGILIRGPEVLESTKRVDTLVLDKTGTITSGHMWVTAVEFHDGSSTEEVLSFASAVEAHHRHPIARAIVDAAIAHTVPQREASDVVDMPGVGVRGVVDNYIVTVQRSATAGVEASTRVDVVVNDTVIGSISIADRPKESSADAISAIREIGLQPMLATGDRMAVAQDVAAIVGIASVDVHAEMKPEDKLDLVRKLQSEGRVVAMVGDGVNDAAALAAADLGIAMGSGSDVAIHSSDLTLVRNDLMSVPDAIRLSRRTLRTIQGNLVWAFGYNVAAIPLAISGQLSPFIAGVAMAFSSVFVVSNSLRLRRFS